MTRPRATAVLPLDGGSVGFESDHPPDQFVTKHVDGELIALNHHEGSYALNRRTEHDVSWYGHGGFEGATHAIQTIADQQAFGCRVNGEFSSIVKEHDRPGLVEIEPLDRGAVVLDDPAHLPVVFHAADGTYVRLRYDDRPRDEQVEEYGRDLFHGNPDHERHASLVVIEERTGPFDAWTPVDSRMELGAIDTAVGAAAERVGFTTTDPSADAISSAIDDATNLFVDADPGMADEIAQQVDVQDKSIRYADTK